MGLLLSAAKAWDSLLSTSYLFLIGKQGVTKEIPLVFRLVDFGHLSGLHYANDIDFKLHKKEYAGEKLLGALLSGKLDDTLVEKSVQWPKISDRLTALLRLKEFLESEFIVYAFSSRKLAFFSRISATFLLYNQVSGEGIFLFLDEKEEQAIFYCKSIFSEGGLNYCANQTRWTVLKKERIDKDGIHLLYQHPRFQENKIHP